MKDVKIGALTFKPKAIRIIALFLLFNVVTFGAMVALKKNMGSSPSIFIVYPLLFMPYLFGSKGIRDNVIVATSNRSLANSLCGFTRRFYSTFFKKKYTNLYFNLALRQKTLSKHES